MRKISSYYGDIFILILIILYGIAIIISKSSVPIFCADTSCYIGLSESIAEHKSYQFNFTPHTKYPPSYPLFLSFFRATKKENQDAQFITSTALLALIGVFASYRLLKHYSSKAAYIITVLLLTSPAFFSMATTTILSDLPYFSFSMTSLLIAIRLQHADTLFHKLLFTILFSIALIVSIMTRTIGIMLPFGCVMWIVNSFFVDKNAALSRLKLLSIPFTLSVISVTIWFLWSESKSVIQYPGEYMDSYLTQMKLIDPHYPELGLASITDLIIRMLNNIGTSAAHLSGLMTHFWIKSSLISVFILPLLLFLGIGIGYRIFTGAADLLLWYFCAYIGMLLLWPFDEGVRFVIPAFPLAGLYIFEGTIKVMDFSRKNSGLFLKISSFSFLLLSLPSIYLLSAGKCTGLQEYISCLLWIFFSVTIPTILLIRRYYGHVNAILKNRLFSPRLMPFHKEVRWAGYAFVVVFCIIGISGQWNISKANRQLKPAGLHNYPLVQAAEWLKTNISHESTICATQKEIIFQISGIKTVPFPVSSSPDLLMSTIEKLGAQYLVIYNEGKFPYFFPTDIERYSILQNIKPALLTCIYEQKDLQIFKIDRQNLVK